MRREEGVGEKGVPKSSPVKVGISGKDRVLLATPSSVFLSFSCCFPHISYPNQFPTTTKRRETRSQDFHRERVEK